MGKWPSTAKNVKENILKYALKVSAQNFCHEMLLKVVNILPVIDNLRYKNRWPDLVLY